MHADPFSSFQVIMYLCPYQSRTGYHVSCSFPAPSRSLSILVLTNLPGYRVSWSLSAPTGYRSHGPYQHLQVTEVMVLISTYRLQKSWSLSAPTGYRSHGPYQHPQVTEVMVLISCSQFFTYLGPYQFLTVIISPDL
jgi:hypothetical protein